MLGIFPKTNRCLRSILIQISKIRQWYLSKSSRFAKIQKHKQILFNQTYFWKSMDHFPYLLIRVKAWYLEQINFLNLLDSQETTNPSKYPIPTLHPTILLGVTSGLPVFLRVLPYCSICLLPGFVVGKNYGEIID